MKEMNRRTFLALSGASVALLALAACGSTPSTPVVPTTGKEAKVLEAINKYRGALPALTLDNGLDPAMELVVKIAKGDMKFGDAMGDLSEVMNHYDDLSAPIGIAADKDTGNMMPVCIYLDDVEKMAQFVGNDEFEAVAIVPLGHIADDCPRAEKKRKALDEIVERR